MKVKPTGGKWVKWKDPKTKKTIEVEIERPWGQSYSWRKIKNKWNILKDFRPNGEPQWVTKNNGHKEQLGIAPEYTEIYTIDGPYNKAKNDKLFKQAQLGSGNPEFARLTPAVTYRVPLDYPTNPVLQKLKAK